MAYKAPLPMRIFHYLLWAFMLFVVAWFLIVPIFLRATAPKPTLQPQAESSSTIAPVSNAVVPTQQPATEAVNP